MIHVMKHRVVQCNEVWYAVQQCKDLLICFTSLLQKKASSCDVSSRYGYALNEMHLMRVTDEWNDPVSGF
jgi:hypothetical protein